MQENWLDLADHFESIDWLHELPKGYLSQKIDQNYSSVQIKESAEKYEIVIAPKDPDQGGDALYIFLDKQLKLLDYFVERIEPAPNDHH